ncbi:LysR family transcriptional regulator [Solimonas soli]|uniref:LysR family transcriptional regulator n=1 Tax=Solimonas soli TaxID=413479 RepID=UPI0004878A44|nr:LysR family transcriptional regulator [Solimonas soli]
MDRLKAAQVFVEVVERGSLTAAAERLDMSRAMVTRGLAAMERWAGARLLHRSTRRLGLTPAGEQTLARCRALLDAADGIEAERAAQDATPRGLLRLSCSSAFGYDLLAPAIAGFLARHPQMAIDVQIVNRIVNLIEERIDLALRITDAPDDALIARRLAPCRSVVCAAPAYLARHGLPRRAEDLVRHNCLTYSYFGKNLWRFERRGRAVEVPVAGNLSSNETAVLLEAALCGAGVVMQPSFAVAEHLRAGRLVALLPAEPPKPLHLYAVYATRRHMPAGLRALLDFLAERYADAPWDAALKPRTKKPA